MKKTISLFLILSMIFSLLYIPAFAESTDEDTPTPFEFKTFTWGDSKTKITDAEGKPEGNGNIHGINADYIYYDTKAVGLEMTLAYYFTNDKLFEIRYISKEKHSNENLFIDDYNKFKNALIKKYGDPLLDTEKFDTDSHRKYYAEKKGDALSYGYLTYKTFWLINDTIISMEMSADNYKISMTVDYQSIILFPGEADFSDEV